MNRYLALSMVVVSMVFFAGCSNGQAPTQTFSNPQNTQQTSKVVQIVAAENFYGDIAQQLAGDHANVVSILSNPDEDPHEYDSTVQDGINVANADIVIENGLDYDTWMDKLIGASPNQNRTVINVGTIAPDILPDNPHIWYGVDNMPVIAQQIHDALVKADPAHSADYDKNMATFDASIAALLNTMDAIKNQFNGTPVALTETIFLYQTKAMNLNVLTPLTFEQDVAEGNDPTAQDIQAANDQVNNKAVKVLIYNKQTVTPITTNLQNEAKQQGIPQVFVTETMPLGKTYQTWMMDQLNALQQSLQQVVQ